MMRAKLLLGLSAVATVAACAGVPRPEGPPAPTSADRHVIRVEETGDRLDIPAPAGAMSLDAQSRAQISTFASSYLRIGHGPLILSAPSAGANADSAARLAHEVRMRLSEYGVPYSAIAGSTYDGSAAPDAPVVLSFTRFEAFAPECAPIWRQDLAHQSNNQTYESFGCAGQANLAAMIEDPHDLVAPRGETARDAGRRSVVLERYRDGQPTGAERSPDEQITISNAIQ